jgi:7-cyano-7-deazaguanine synthase
MPKFMGWQMLKKAVVLLSGGLDSTTCLALAKSQGFDCYALSFSYGQRHSVELNAATQIAQSLGAVEHKIVNLDTNLFSGSALTNRELDVPVFEESAKIPVTYVPARNTIFLAMALGYAESRGAQALFIGASSIDFSQYPDCRPEFIKAFQNLANCATKAAIEGKPITVYAPLQYLNKIQTIQLGIELGIDYGLTISCYQATDNGKACGHCDSCTFRKRGFAGAGIVDPTQYS